MDDFGAPHGKEAAGSRGADLDATEAARIAALSKTKLCKFFARDACARGDDCTFAHGRQQLQRRRRPPPPEPPSSRGRAPRAALPAAPPAERAVAERDAVARELAEARMETARLKEELQLLHVMKATAAAQVGSPYQTFEGYPGFHAVAEDASPQSCQSWLGTASTANDTAGHASDDSGTDLRAAEDHMTARDNTSEHADEDDDFEVTLTVKNTFVDVVAPHREAPHRRTSSVPPRNQWLLLWAGLAGNSL